MCLCRYIEHLDIRAAQLPCVILKSVHDDPDKLLDSLTFTVSIITTKKSKEPKKIQKLKINSLKFPLRDGTEHLGRRRHERSSPRPPRPRPRDRNAHRRSPPFQQ